MTPLYWAYTFHGITFIQLFLKYLFVARSAHHCLCYFSLYQEASHMSEEELQQIADTAMHKRSIITELKELSESNPKQLHSILTSGEGDDDAIEAENIDKFVAKVGRYAMKKERDIIKQAHGKYHVDYLFNIRDPNLHGDLFHRPHLNPVIGKHDLFENDEDGNGAPDEMDWSDLGTSENSEHSSHYSGNTRVIGRQTSFMNVFQSVKKSTRQSASDSNWPARNAFKRSSSHSFSEPQLKLPPINGATKQTGEQGRLLQSYSHLTFDLGRKEDNEPVGDSTKKKMKKIPVKDPLLCKAPVPVKYKLSKL